MKQWKSAGLAALLALALAVPAGAFHTHGEAEPPVFEAASWAQPELMEAYEAGLLTDHHPALDYRGDITRIEFCRMLTNYLAVQQNTDLDMLEGMTLRFLAERDEEGNVVPVFTDCPNQWEERDAVIGYCLGLVQGKGQGRFDPQGYLTRQEAAAMLTRAQEILGGTLPEEKPVLDYADSEAVDTWASESVAALQSWQVMRGKENNLFCPQDRLTFQECAVLCLRLHQQAPVGLAAGNVQPIFTYEQGLEHLEGIDAESRQMGTGQFIAFRLDGPRSSLVRMDWGGSMQATSKLYFVSREGGARYVDLGLCIRFKTLTPDMELEDPRFSEDGQTFLCDVRLTEDSTEMVDDGEPQITHERGLYHVTVDVTTGETQLAREDLPAE